MSGKTGRLSVIAGYIRKYGTTGLAIVESRYKPIKLMRQGGT
jgi:hypothetical protein